MNIFSDFDNLFLPSKKGHLKTETMLVIRNRRIRARYISLLIACIGIFFVSEQRTAQIFLASILVGIPGIIFLMISDLTVTADKTQETLTLRYRSILYRRTKVLPFSDVLQMTVQSQKGTNYNDSKESDLMHRLAVHTVKGLIPLRFLCSSNNSSMANDGAELANFIGVEMNYTD